MAIRLSEMRKNLAADSGATGTEIAALESHLQRTLPTELKKWLRICRGEAIGPGGIYGIRPDRAFLDIRVVLAQRTDWDGRGWLPIAGDGCGSAYVLIEKGPLSGSVCFVDVLSDDSAIEYVAASGLLMFLRFLLARELGERGWPFNEKMVQACDPQISGYQPL